MSDLLKIYTNVQAMKARISLNKINREMGTLQVRLATGRRINSASEDPAGYHLAKTLERRRRGLEVALQNVRNAQNILDVAEGAYQNVMDILQTLKEKVTQAADYSLSSTQRQAIQAQLNALLEEIDDIVSETKFNESNLINGNYSGYFHTGEGSDDQMFISLQNADSAALGLDGISLSTQADASAAIASFSTAIDTLASIIQDIGEYKVRLAAKEDMLEVAITNTDSVRSMIEDADFAKDQMELLKLQILQQTAIASLTQANTAPQVVLNLFR